MTSNPISPQTFGSMSRLVKEHTFSRPTKPHDWLMLAIVSALKGRVPVSVGHRTHGYRPGMQMQLMLGQSIVEIAPDDIRDVQPLDVGPIGLVAGAYWVFDTSTSRNAQCARWAVWPISVVSMTSAAWAQRLVSRRGDSSHGEILAVHVSDISCSSRCIEPDYRKTPRTAGQATLSVSDWFECRRDDVATVLARSRPRRKVGRILGPDRHTWVGSLALPRENFGRRLARELLWVGAASLTTAKLRRSIEESAKSLEMELAEKSKMAEETGFEEGRSFVIKLVSEARYSLQRQLGRSEQLDRRLRSRPSGDCMTLMSE